VGKDTKELDMAMMVAMRPGNSRKKSFLYKSRRTRTMKTAVQRLTPICPAQEARNLFHSKINYNAIINSRFVVLSK
jgi:hypothetical protein